MGQKDLTEKHLEEYNDVFADIVNVLLFGGEKVVQQQDLENSTAKSQYKADNSRVHEQERDVAKFWKSGAVKIAIYGLENQTQIDKDMPLRIMGYDGQSYRSQLIGNNKKKRFPVLTLVLYFGTKHWTGPRTLHEALELPEHLKPYVSDYKIQVFEIAFLEEEQVELFQSDFKYVADYFVQMRKKKDYTPSKETMEHVDAVLKIMSVLTNDSRFEEAQNDGTEVRSMCEVLDRVERRGIEQGIQQGKMEGMQQGIKEGIHILVESLREFGQMDEQILSKIMEKYGLPKEEAEKYICQ